MSEKVVEEALSNAKEYIEKEYCQGDHYLRDSPTLSESKKRKVREELKKNAKKAGSIGVVNFSTVVPVKTVNKWARNSKRLKELAGIKELPKFIKRKCSCGDFHLCTKVTEEDLK